MLKEYTIETRLEAPAGSDIRIYLDDFVVFYNKVYREMWHEMITPDHNKRYTRSRYISCICSKYGLLKRTVNSIYFDIQGRMNSKGLYRSKDGTIINADINGAANIIRKVYGKINIPLESLQKIKRINVTW